VLYVVAQLMTHSMLLLTCLIADANEVSWLARYKRSSAIRSWLLCQGKNLQRQHLAVMSAAATGDTEEQYGIVTGASILCIAELQLGSFPILPILQSQLLLFMWFGAVPTY
jgi:hypothetical protein